MPEEAGVVTVLILLPVHHNPDAAGRRDPVEDENFTTTAEEIAIAFQAGGTLHMRREGTVSGFWWDRGIVDRDVLAILEVDLLLCENRAARALSAEGDLHEAREGGPFDRDRRGTDSMT